MNANAAICSGVLTFSLATIWVVAYSPTPVFEILYEKIGITKSAVHTRNNYWASKRHPGNELLVLIYTICSAARSKHEFPSNKECVSLGLAANNSLQIKAWCLSVERLFCRVVYHLCMPDGRRRSDVKVGSKVRIVEKKNQPSGKLTDGIVSRILTNSPNHPHGIKVQLDNGLIGRVKEIVALNDTWCPLLFLLYKLLYDTQ